MILRRALIVAAVLFCIAPHAFAQEASEPGKSLWGITLGSSREQAVAAVKSKLKKAGRQPSRKHPGGYVEDMWDIPVNRDQTNSFEVLSRNGKVVQLRAWSTKHTGEARLTFAQLIQRYPLKKSAYSFVDPEGGGAAGFFYDDVRRGVCYAMGLQDVMLLTYRPDSIIVHHPGIPVIPIVDGVRGKPLAGEGAEVYADEAAYLRASQRRNGH
jgi:hypothetical protein